MVLRTTKYLQKFECSEAIKVLVVKNSLHKEKFKSDNVFSSHFLPQRMVFFENPEWGRHSEKPFPTPDNNDEALISLAEIEEVEKIVFENSHILDAIQKEYEKLKFSGEHLEETMHDVRLRILNHILEPLDNRLEVPKSLLQKQAHLFLEAELQSLKERNALLRQIDEQNIYGKPLSHEVLFSKTLPETSSKIQTEFLNMFMVELDKNKGLSEENKKILRGLAKVDIGNHEHAILESLQNGSAFTFDQIKFSFANDYLAKITGQPIVRPVEPVEETVIPKDVIGEAKKRFLAHQAEGNIEYKGKNYHFKFDNAGANRVAQLTVDIPGDGSKVLTLKMPKKRRDDDIYGMV